MNKFDSRSMKFLGMILAICIVFVLIIGNAFKYLPEDNLNSQYLNDIEENSLVQEKKSAESSVIEDEQEEIEDEDIDEPVLVSKETPKTESLEVIPDEELIEGKGVLTVSTESNKTEVEKIIEKAIDYKKNKQYSLAINEYQKILGMTNDVNLKASCYENISLIHAIEKHYGSAISAAQRAYNLSPSTKREVLLARLHYKTGDINRATERINNVLKRDFDTND